MKLKKQKMVVPVDPNTLPVRGTKEREKLEACLGEMVAGKLPASTPMTEYLLKQYQEGRIEFQAVQQGIQELQGRLGALQSRQSLLEGVVNKYADDLRYWTFQATQKKESE